MNSYSVMQDNDQTPVDLQEAYPIDKEKDRYPFCIVWTPLPFLSWFIPIIGHMGIAMSSGVIRDFGGPYYVAEDNFTFGRPTKYWRLDPMLARSGVPSWDSGVSEASDIYKGRMHNIFCDNCHSHVAKALNLMQYEGLSNWNMVTLALMVATYSKYVNFWGFIKTWGPFIVMVSIILCCVYLI